eukprot:COSAG02_NODE_28493_length_588_cov_1.163599_1_plen_65_part_10
MFLNICKAVHSSFSIVLVMHAVGNVTIKCELPHFPCMRSFEFALQRAKPCMPPVAKFGVALDQTA